MVKSNYIKIVIRILLLIINGIILYHLFDKTYTITFFAAGLFLVLQIFLFLDYLKYLFADIEKSIDCLLHDDYSLSIPKEKRKNSLHNKTALLIEKHKERTFKQTSEQLIFTNIIENLTTGILILRKDVDQQIEVFQINNIFTNFLKIPKYYSWDTLKEKIAPLLTVIDTNNWKKVKHTISLSINEQTETFFLKTSVTKTYNYEYLIISLETIQQVIDKKEKEAWHKLMNVMSHEIINTITPISSLAENLNSLLQEETPDKETLDELSKGLGIIKKRSYHLTSFVDTYRKLAELPLPEKEQIDVCHLIESTLTLFQQEFEENNVNIDFNCSQKFIINADEKQIEQVFINLISNSLNSFTDTNNPNITIHISYKNNRTIISFSDNGSGISDEIKANIFIPYFTTRKNGSGIGLTLAKSIIESHNGNIYFNSKEGETTFIVSFVN